MAVRGIDDADLAEVDPCRSATSRIFVSGPTRIGVISPSAAASKAPASDDSSHGCATAVATGSRWRVFVSARSYFPVPVSRVMLPRDVQWGSALKPFAPEAPSL